MPSRSGWWLLLGLLGVAASFLTPVPAEAQSGAVLSLNEALDRARSHNPEYRMALNELELTGVGRRQALGAFLPNLSLSLGTGLNLNRQLISTDFFGNPIENPESEWQTSSSSSQTLGGSVSLFEGGQRFHQLNVESSQARAREIRVESRLRTVQAEVVRTYYQALNQQSLLAVEVDLLDGRELDLELTRRMYDLAGATRVEVLAAELNVQRQEQRIQQIQAQLSQQRLSLRRVLGDPDLGDFRLAQGVAEPFSPAVLDLEALVSAALASHPLIREQEAQVEVSRAQASAARGSRWPTVSLSFSTRQGVYAQERGALFDMYPDQSRSAGTSLSFSIPIFSRFQTQAQVVQAAVGRDNALETLRATRLQLEADLRSRFIALETAFQGYEIALRSREIAQERLRLAREQFRLGSRTFNELQRDIDDGASAEREVINQLFGFLQARVNLEETVGPVGDGAAGGEDSAPDGAAITTGPGGEI